MEDIQISLTSDLAFPDENQPLHERDIESDKKPRRHNFMYLCKGQKRIKS